MKIIDKIRQCFEKEQLFYSFEFFPPKTSAGVENLYTRMDRMAELEPLFCDMTWVNSSSNGELTVEISTNAQKYCGVEMLMHLSCARMTEHSVRLALQQAKQAGIQNILALRGELPVSSKDSDQQLPFTHAVDLVRFIQQEFGDYFGIAVAGYPEGHPESTDMESDIKYLKEKVDAGADFVLTQFFYDIDSYQLFVEECRKAGINCPIIPGIMAIQNYGGFSRMTTLCKTAVPQDVLDELAPIKSNDEAVKEYGIKLGIDMCQKLLAVGAPGLHFYTLNLERSVRNILSGLDVSSNKSIANHRELPWRPSTIAKRASETVRPIFWANRPKSYLHRTSTWDEFPNGRWGDNRSPAFGELNDSHYTRFNRLSIEDRKSMWGESPINHEDVYETFTRYVMGAISRLPWCEVALHLETLTIQEKLASINRAGFLTINSQPRVSGIDSDDPCFGWGGPGGKVYQKAYLECFVSPANLKDIIEAAATMKHIQYHAVDIQGHSYSNYGKGATAVTWGIFPNREVLQPTIVDTESFMAWKDEAFSLWLTMWASLYHEESVSNELIYEIHDTFFLVSIVDNDFINGNIWELFDKIQQTKSASPLEN